jgi:protein O-GlcNAc transferase
MINWKDRQMGIFDRLRTTAPAVANSDENRTDTTEQDATRLIDQGHVLEAAGKLDEALQCYLDAIRLAPNPARAHLNHGNILLLKGDLDGALDAFRAAIKHKPGYAGAYYNMGNALLNAGKLDDAVANYRQALEIQPDYAEVHCVLGVALKELGQFSDAVASLQRALEINSDLAEARTNLSNFLEHLHNTGIALLYDGKPDQAMAIFQRVMEVDPNRAETHTGIGVTLHGRKQIEDAMACYRRALQINPDYAEAHFYLGNALKDLDQLGNAAECYRRAIELKSEFAEAYENLGTTLQTLGQTNTALSIFRQALKLQPQALQHAIHAHLLLPVIPESPEAPASIAEWRERYQNGIAALMNIPDTLVEPGHKLGSPSFYLAYHNADDRSLMEALCKLFRAHVPDLTVTAPHVLNWRPPAEKGRRIRVGFLSEYLSDHTIGKHYLGFIHHLDRNRFEVVVIHGFTSKQDAFRQNLDALSDKALTLPSGLKDQQQAVAAEQLDVLFYPDIGMAPPTYFLAYARLAPVQATSWGHPDTTGLDTMDYFVSAVTNEPEEAEAYYTERLIRLNRLPCYYYRTLAASIPKFSKAELGLPENGILYGCLQSMFKFHPDFDAVLAAIATGDPTGYLILPEGKYSAWTDLLKARWAKTFPSLLERVVFIPRMSWSRFMAIMAHMDVLLDPLHFGSGNTLYDAMVNGTPVVTWPGRFARGRNVAAAYQQMGVADAPVAHQLEDYAPLALALGRDSERRRSLRTLSLEAAGRELFNDIQAIRELEAFLEAAIAAATQGIKLPSAWRPNVKIRQI